MTWSIVASLFQPHHLLLALGGNILGIVFGAIPGLSASTALALLLPLSFSMPPETGIIFLGNLDRRRVRRLDRIHFVGYSWLPFFDCHHLRWLSHDIEGSVRQSIRRWHYFLVYWHNRQLRCCLPLLSHPRSLGRKAGPMGTL